MSLSELLDDRYTDENGIGDYADPRIVTHVGRVLKNANSAGGAASMVVTTQPCLLVGFTVSSANASAQFVQLFNLPAVPGDTAVPTLVFKVSATDVLPMSFVPYPRAFLNGLVICNSSTQHTKTIGSADCIFDVQYI